MADLEEEEKEEYAAESSENNAEVINKEVTFYLIT